MPLPTPILDDRSYQQLRDELVRRIPVYAPEWTDHNASDPGITLVELFAFLGENLLYRFNQIPDATRLAFLQLLQIPLRPATPAQALVELLPTAAGSTLVPLSSRLLAGSVPFETLDEVVVWPLQARGVARTVQPPPDPASSQAGYAEASVDARGGLQSGEQAVYYTADVTPADPSAPDAAVVDFARTADGLLWVAVIGTRDTQLSALGGAVLNLGFVPDPQLASMQEAAACPGADASSAPAPETVWEVSTKETSGGSPVYRTLELVGDGTRGLSQEGVVRLRLPQDPSVLAPHPPVDDPAVLGTGDFPPVLVDQQLESSVVFWLRAYRRDGGDFGRVLWLGANVAGTRQTQAATPEFLGLGTGEAYQSYRLVHAPVIDGSLVLEVEEADGWRPWTAVDDFRASAEDARNFVLDPEAGTVRFGNGVRGRAPQIGERIRAREYRYGGGDAGNVPPKAISKADAFPRLKAQNPLRAHGGAPVESLESALERIPGEVRRHDRAVTAGDFQELALQTPGADVGRAECLPRFRAALPNQELPGVVTVVVWPREDAAHPNAPSPTRDVLRAVCAWLDARRLVTTELYVVPPAYRKVAVAVGLHVKDGYGVEAVRRWVELVLRQYLAPLPPYGPDGGGWPLGRRVYGPELEAAALQVEGVEYLEGLTVAQIDADGVTWLEGTVELAKHEVPQLESITVVAGPPLPVGQPVAPPAVTTDSGKTAVAVPIPIPRLEC